MNHILFKEVIKAFIGFLLVCSCLSSTAQDLKAVDSKFINETDSLLVYKPSTYNMGKQYPLVYLLHGHSASYKSWGKLVDLQRLADDYDAIVVCPDGQKKSWYFNSPNKIKSQYEDFFFKELVPFIHKNYSVDSNKIFISGASMGGHGALWLFMHHPNYFRSAGSTSGVVNLRHSGFKLTTLAEHLGEYSAENINFDNFSVVNNIQLLAKAAKPIIFDIGTEDYLYKSNKAFRDSCDVYHVKAKYIAQPGKHVGGYWSKSILEHFTFFFDLLNPESKIN